MNSNRFIFLMDSVIGVEIGIGIVKVFHDPKYVVVVMLSVISFFFITYLRYVLRVRKEQSTDAPFWINRRVGVGVSLNSRNPKAYRWILYLIGSILIFLLALNTLILGLWMTQK